jgi:hypothetical protein
MKKTLLLVVAVLAAISLRADTYKNKDDGFILTYKIGDSMATMTMNGDKSFFVVTSENGYLYFDNQVDVVLKYKLLKSGNLSLYKVKLGDKVKDFSRHPHLFVAHKDDF